MSETCRRCGLPVIDGLCPRATPPTIEDTIDSLRDRIFDLEHILARYKRGYDFLGIEAEPCPGCVYDHGKFVRRCQLHETSDRLRRELDTAARVLAAVQADSNVTLEQRRRAEQSLSDSRLLLDHYKAKHDRMQPVWECALIWHSDGRDRDDERALIEAIEASKQEDPYE